MGQINFPEPPKTGNDIFDRYMLEVHHQLFNLDKDADGTLDADNGVLTTSSTTSDVAEGSNLYHTVARVNTIVVPKVISMLLATLPVTVSDDGSQVTYALDKVTDPTDVGALATTETADATYSSNEQDMLNNIKTDLGTLKTKINLLLANMRTADHI
jgi:hypothetical protein